MGVKDLESMFEMIDVSCKGAVSVDQLHEFCEALYESPVYMQHVEGAAKLICKLPTQISRREFLDVLTDVERRRAVDEEAYWDFQALDYTGKSKITLHNALLLFKEIHGDSFSMSTWNRFLSSRQEADSDVYFDEIRFWLCSPPIGSACSDKDLKTAENEILASQTDYLLNTYTEMRDAMDDDASRKADADEHTEHQTSNAKRKLNKWNKQGVEAMIFDDGLDVDDTEVKVKCQGQVSLSDLNELLEVKYEALKETLLREMATQASAVEDEIPELLEQVRRQAGAMMKRGSDMADQVPGGAAQMPASLTGLMGELRLHDREHRRQMEELKVSMKDKGRPLRDIALAVQQKYEEIIAGDTSCAGLMQQLHRRHRQERETLISTLKLDSRYNMTQAIVVEYMRLIRQIAIIEEEKSFVAMATAVGLAERAMEPKLDRADWDRSRSERLAQLRIEERVGKQPVTSSHAQPDLAKLEKEEVINLQVEVTKETTLKHFHEREALIYMMFTKEARTHIDKARKLKSDERKSQLKALQSQHKTWKSNPRADKSILLTMLKQALGLRFEERRTELEDGGSAGNISFEEMREIILADLQQRQGVDCELLIHDIHKMGAQQVIVALGRQYGSRVGEHYDNIASVLLGTMEVTEEDEDYMKAVEHKYTILRKRIFLMALKDKLDWKDMAKPEKQTCLRDIDKQEKLLRSEGKLQQMEELLGPKAKAKILPPLRNLIGEGKPEYERRKLAHKPDESAVDQTKVVNLLADLVPRHDAEQEHLLSWLHSAQGKSSSLRMKRMKIVETKIETCRVEMEEDFEIASLSAGLMERVRDTLSHRHERDMDRQSELSRRRVQQRRLRLQQHEEYRKDPQIAKDNVPAAGDITGLQVVYLHEMLKHHADEREVVLVHLQDETLDDLIEAATTMTDEDRQRRLTELQGKRQNLNLTNDEDKEEHVCIMEETAALRAVSVRQQLAASGQSNNMEMVAMVILAELQEEQDREVALTLQHVENMNEEDLRISLSREINNRRLGNAWNVITVLTRHQGEATDDLLLKALENKYTMLRHKLLVDALKVRMGTDQWQDLSQNEKQQKLIVLDNQALEQIKMGKIMPSLLGEDFHLQESLAQLMAVCQHVFRNKIKGQQVTGNKSNLSMEEDPGVISKTDKPDNPLSALVQRLEQDKLSLARQLKGQAEEHFSDGERLIQLARYHRETLLANQHDSFITVATMVGLMERQQQQIHFRLQRDMERYENLASKLLHDINNGKNTTLNIESPNRKSITDLVDYLLALLENKHVLERELFSRLLDNTEKSGHQEDAAMCSPQDRKLKMSKLMDARTASVQARKCENVEILSEGTCYKMEERRAGLEGNHGDVSHDKINQSLMASLLEYQNSEAQRLLKSLAGMNESSMHSEEQKIAADTKSKMADNIALVVLSPDPADEASNEELLEALDSKYDALKDKLLAEALMNELGEAEWNRLSEKERQRRIFQLKMKERQLRRDGKVDEANALIAGLLADQENLSRLMGDSEENQRRKLEERLRKRRERLAQGMSEAEVDELEKQDIADEEEEERKQKRNILDDLQHRHDQEREELLQRLRDAGDSHDRERERQANLARLRRDERLAKREDNFDSAALIIGLAKQRDKDLQLKRDEERRRQEKLARERLEAARNRARGGKQDEAEEATQDVNTDDALSLQDAITRDMDKRHQQERNTLIKLMEESVSSGERKAAVKMSDIERDDRLFELREMYRNWNNSEDKDLKEQMNMLKDAIALMLEIMRSESAASGEEDLTEDELQVKLLADLQQLQQREADRLLTDINNQDLAGLQQLHKALSVMKKHRNYDNMAAVLLERSRSDESEAEGGTSEASVLQALEDKYDAMKDKLLMEALMKDLGEREWDRLSEKDRQKKLIELKLKERQLRREGKFDEIANIIGSHLENEKLLDQLIVETAEEQRERLKEKLARRKQLIAEREAQGLTTDDATIDGIIEEEEEQKVQEKRRNILESLQRNYDDEKAALLQSLSNHTDKVAAERLRQIELAKLKRDQRRMRKGEQLSDVAMIIHEAREDDRKREEGITSERERQRALAKQRLEARRQKYQGGQMTDEGLKEKLAQDEELDALQDAVRQAEGQSIHEALLATMENKQGDEMDMLMALLELAQTDKTAANMPDEDLKMGLAQLEQDQLKWRKRSAQQSAQLDENKLTREQSQEHMTDVACNRSDQLKLLTNAVVYRLEVERRTLKETRPEMSQEGVQEEIEVAMVTDLQEKQTAESRAVQKLLDDQNESVLREMKRNLHLACREGWYDNLTQTVFHISHTETAWEEEDQINQQYEDNLAKLEQDVETKTQDTIKKARASGEPIDEEAIRRQIMEQYEQTRQKLLSEKQAQKVQLTEKLNARKMTKEQKNYELMTAHALINQAQENIKNIEKNVSEERGKQSTVLQQRLADRRAARQEAKNIKDSMERETTLDSQDRNRGASSRGSQDSPLPPFGGMRREKTVLDVDISEEQKQAMLSQMVQQQRIVQSKITEQQRRQEEMLRRRLDVRMGKQQEEVAEVLSIGQRQKTTLQKSRQDEKERQLQIIQDRLNKQREKREPSPSNKKVMK